jgi:hypothetical protein
MTQSSGRPWTDLVAEARLTIARHTAIPKSPSWSKANSARDLYDRPLAAWETAARPVSKLGLQARNGARVPSIRPIGRHSVLTVPIRLVEDGRQVCKCIPSYGRRALARCRIPVGTEPVAGTAPRTCGATGSAVDEVRGDDANCRFCKSRAGSASSTCVELAATRIRRLSKGAIRPPTRASSATTASPSARSIRESESGSENQ